VEYKSLGRKETLQFKQDVGLKNLWTFEALNMSDGTLRVLGILLAVYQPQTPSLIAIVEFESWFLGGLESLRGRQGRLYQLLPEHLARLRHQ